MSYTEQHENITRQMFEANERFDKAARQMRTARNLFIVAFVVSVITTILGFAGWFCA